MKDAPVMLDLRDCTLHACSRGTAANLLLTKCGRTLDEATLGPLSALLRRGATSCQACFGVGADQGDFFDPDPAF